MRKIAERFSNMGEGLSLNTEALARYHDIIDLSIGDHDIHTDDRIIDAAARDAKAGYTRYGQPMGDPELREAIRRVRAEDLGDTVEPDEVLVTTSSCLGMQLALLATVNPGEEIIVFSPYFSLYKQQIMLAGGVCIECETFPEEQFAISRERLEAVITSKTRGIVFGNPVNPTGMFYDENTLNLLAEVADEHDLIIYADEIYTDYLLPGYSFRSLRTVAGMKERAIILNSFSKNYIMTGWRLGCAIADPEIIRTMHRLNGAMTYSAPSVSQRAAIEALRLRQEIRATYVKEYLDRLQYAAMRIQNLRYLDLVPPKGTFYLFPGIRKTGMTSVQFTEDLLERAHIMVSPGALFGAAGEYAVRIAVTAPISKLQEAFDRMEELDY